MATDLTVLRLTTCAGVVRYWDFFQRGIVETAKFLRYDLPLETYQKMFFHLVRTPSAWIGVALEEDGTPVSFAVAHECTPLFSEKREYEVSFIFHNPGRSDATSALQATFEDYCRKHGIRTIYATTRRDSGSTIRCFQSPRYGFKRAYTTFKKDLR